MFPPLSLLLTALALAQAGLRPSQTEGSVQPGHLAFALGAPPRLPAQLVKPLFAEGRLVPGYFIVHFRGPITPADKAWLDELTGSVRRDDGTQLARAYVPDDALLAWVERTSTWLALRRSPRTDWIGRYEPAYKLDPTLWGARECAPLLLDVDLVPGHAPQRVVEALESLGARVLEQVHYRGRRGHDLAFLVVEAAEDGLAELAGVEGIRVIQRRGVAQVVGDGGLPRALDSFWIAELSRRFGDGRPLGRRLAEAPLGAGHDQVAAFLDLLAFDHPAVLACIEEEELAGAGGSDEPVKNALAGTLPDAERVSSSRADSAHGRATRDVPAASPSAALQKALALGGADASVISDTPESAGFTAPGEPAHVYSMRAFGAEDGLAVTLVWTDEPGSAGPAKPLQNDLDLIVTAPDGTVYRGGPIETETPAGGAADSSRNVERVVLAAPRPGLWRLSVRAARGPYSVRQGYALVASGLGGGGAFEPLLAPTTLTLRVNAAWNSKNGTLGTGDLVRFSASDDNRYNLRNGEQLTLAFDDGVPLGTSLTAVRFFVEHHEEPRVGPGEILWKLARGSLTAPTLVATTAAPLRLGPGAEVLDLWTSGALVPDANDLELVVQNTNRDDDTVLDRIFAEVDLLASSVPVIVSTASAAGVVGQAYRYDADSRAEASASTPVTWTSTGAPSGFSIDATTGLVRWTPGAVGAFAVTIGADNEFGTASQSFTVQVSGAPPLPATLFPATVPSLVYLPPERLARGPALPEQRLNVFLPPGVPPLSGWPVVLNNRAGGGRGALPLATLVSTGATAPLHAFVAKGIAVVDFGVTSLGDGLGLFYPPGHASGRYESFLPGDDNPEKEAEWAIQWLKSQSAFPLDASRICVRGSSQGAMIALWATMGPDRARASGSPQVLASTRVKGVLALQPPTSLWAFDQTPALASRMIAHFEQAAQPGVAAIALAQVAEGLQKDSSIMRFAFDTLAARVNNERQAICLLYNEPVKRVGVQPADMTLDALGYPRLHDTLAQPFLHDSWSGYVLYRRLLDLSPSSAAFHGANSVFAVRDTSALAPPFAFHTRTYSGTITSPQANAIAHEWVLRTLN